MLTPPQKKTKNKNKKGIDVWYRYPDQFSDITSTPPSRTCDFSHLDNLVMSPHRCPYYRCLYYAVSVLHSVFTTQCLYYTVSVLHSVCTTQCLYNAVSFLEE